MCCHLLNSLFMLICLYSRNYIYLFKSLVSYKTKVNDPCQQWYGLQNGDRGTAKLELVCNLIANMLAIACAKCNQLHIPSSLQGLEGRQTWARRFSLSLSDCKAKILHSNLVQTKAGTCCLLDLTCTVFLNKYKQRRAEGRTKM